MNPNCVKSQSIVKFNDGFRDPKLRMVIWISRLEAMLISFFGEAPTRKSVDGRMFPSQEPKW